MCETPAESAANLNLTFYHFSGIMNTSKGRKTQQTRKEVDIMTKLESINYIINTYSDDLPQDVLESAIKIKTQLEKAAAADRKPSKKERERKDANEQAKAAILARLSDGSHLTVSELIKSIDLLNNETTQKVSALCRLLKLEGKIDKEVVKGKTLFFSL